MLDLWNVWIDALHTPFNASAWTCFLCIDNLTLDGDGVGARWGKAPQRESSGVERLGSNSKLRCGWLSYLTCRLAI